MQVKFVSEGEPVVDPRQLLQNLAGRCHQLEVRRDALDLAESAVALTKSPDAVAFEANALRTRIDAFVLDHKPSKRNATLIRFAQECLETTRSNKIVPLTPFPNKHCEPLALAEILYELAGLLYHGHFSAFTTLLNQKLNHSEHEALLYHITVCQGDMKCINTMKERLKVVQGMLGYAHHLADYYLGPTPYPALTEIHTIFKELASLNTDS